MKNDTLDLKLEKDRTYTISEIMYQIRNQRKDEKYLRIAKSLYNFLKNNLYYEERLEKIDDMFIVLKG